MQGTQVWSLVMGLRSHMPCSRAKIKRKKVNNASVSRVAPAALCTELIPEKEVETENWEKQSSVPWRTGRASSPRHSSGWKCLSAPSGSTEETSPCSFIWGWWGLSSILCLDSGDTLAVPQTWRSGLQSPRWSLLNEFQGWLFSSLQKIMVTTQSFV